MEKDCSSCVAGEIELLPWGFHQIGNEWSFKAKQGRRITQIIIRHAEIIDSLIIESGDDLSTKFGGNGGNKTTKISIDFPSEFLTGISGTFRSHNRYGDIISSLKFHTNKTEYGSFGTLGGTQFCGNHNGGVVTGFYGRYGKYLHSLGIYIVPASSISTQLESKRLNDSAICFGGVPRFLFPPPSAAAVGGNGGREWDDGVFAAVKAMHVSVRIDTGVVSAVRFSYLKSDGADFLSPFHGASGDGDTHRKTVLFSEEDEYLIGVEGFQGEIEGGSNVIKSLSFITNKSKYGPVGHEIGTHFRCINFNGKVVGFHGRSGVYLNAIGLHTQYFHS